MGAGGSSNQDHNDGKHVARAPSSFSLDKTPIPPSLRELFSGDADNPKASALRTQGNTAFQARDYSHAIELYSAAIEQLPGDARLYSNRSAAHAALSQHGKSLADAMMACQLQPAWPKGHFRLGTALLALGRWVDAHDSLSRALALDPGSSAIREKHREAEGKVQPGLRGAPGVFTWGGGDFGALGHGDARPAARCLAHPTALPSQCAAR